MAIKASSTITLSFMIDIEASYRYYKLQSSTASKPAVPTTRPPAGWTDSEPSYTSGSTNTLYFVDCTLFTNGSFLYSAVSKSSSYEAAKEAYNKAVAAQSAVDSMEIGGRNLFKGTGDYTSKYWENTDLSDYELDTNYKMSKHTGSGYFTATQTAIQGFDFSDSTKQWTISAMFKGSADNQTVGITLDANRINYTPRAVPNGKWGKLTWTFYGSTTLMRFRFEATNASESAPIYVAQAKCERGSKATDWTPAPEDIENSLSDFVDSVTGDIDSLQAQIDGNITTYFYNYEPTTSNVPASNWTTTALKNQHLGDLFYIVDNTDKNGQVYRWALVSGAYKWVLVEDADVTKALADAAKAQDTADAKRRVFVSQPTPPYDIGDIWTQGSNGDILTCKTARESGSYVSTDWSKSSKYTDDTTVNNLQIGGRNLLLASDVEYSNNNYNLSSHTPSSPLVAGETYTISVCVTPAAGVTKLSPYVSGGWSCLTTLWTTGTEKQILSNTFIASYYSGKTPDDNLANADIVVYRFPNDGTVTTNSTLHWIKIEKGDKATDWTPAPEDVDTDIKDAQGRADTAQGTADSAVSRVNTAELAIESIKGIISTLVTDANGASLMIQNGDGWTFSTSAIENAIAGLQASLSNLNVDLGTVNETITTLQGSVQSWDETSEYVQIGEYNDEPCIYLSESDTKFRLAITNTQIMFLEGSNVLTYITNAGLHTDNIVVDNEFRQGNFIWVVRANGNYGLQWKETGA